jgi:prevent-host-death family protein
MSVEVNVHEAKTHLSRLLEQALAGEDVVIMKAGRPLVRLTVVEGARKRRRLGTAKGDFVTPADFDAALPNDVVAEFEK